MGRARLWEALPTPSPRSPPLPRATPAPCGLRVGHLWRDKWTALSGPLSRGHQRSRCLVQHQAASKVDSFWTPHNLASVGALRAQIPTRGHPRRARRRCRGRHLRRKGSQTSLQETAAPRTSPCTAVGPVRLPKRLARHQWPTFKPRLGTHAVSRCRKGDRTSPPPRADCTPPSRATTVLGLGLGLGFAV